MLSFLTGCQVLAARPTWLSVARLTSRPSPLLRSWLVPSLRSPRWSGSRPTPVPRPPRPRSRQSMPPPSTPSHQVATLTKQETLRYENRSRGFGYTLDYFIEWRDVLHFDSCWYKLTSFSFVHLSWHSPTPSFSDSFSCPNSRRQPGRSEQAGLVQRQAQ